MTSMVDRRFLSVPADQELRLFQVDQPSRFRLEVRWVHVGLPILGSLVLPVHRVLLEDRSSRVRQARHGLPSVQEHPAFREDQ